MNRIFILITLLILSAGLAGCRQPVTNPPARQSLFDFNRGGAFGRNQFANNNVPNLDIQANSPQQYQAFNNLSSQVTDLNQRIGAFDSDNQQLYTEIAALKQKLQLANDYTQQLKQQMGDASGQFRQLQMENASAKQQLAASRFQMEQLNRNAQLQQQQLTQSQSQLAKFGGGGTPAQLAGRATVRANNSLLQNLDQIQIPGGEVRMDGDVIRMEFPSDSLFVAGTYQIQAAQIPMMQNVVGTIRQTFPKQIIGIEAHWDGTPLSPPGTSHHQLTATQSLAVFNELNRLGLTSEQMFIMGLGSNRQRHSNVQVGNNRPNRRIEIVIYPEKF